MGQVRCASCHRTERWSAEGVVEAVLSEGGARRVTGAPQLHRGRTALAAFEGVTGPVVGVCESCGQLMVADEPGPAPIEVRVDTPQGALVVGPSLTLAGQPIRPEAARAFLDRQYPAPSVLRFAGQLPQIALLASMLGPVLLFVACVLAIWSFLGAAWQGVPDIVAPPR
jgi:hypothetical protein